MNKFTMLALGLAVLTVPTAFGQGKFTAKVTAAQAAKTALAKYHGSLAKKPLLEKEDGKWQYEVIVKTGKTMHEVNVDATTGKITSTETVTAKEEATEKKAEAKKGKG